MAAVMDYDLDLQLEQFRDAVELRSVCVYDC